jgi:PAS domain S-box-containing protein
MALLALDGRVRKVNSALCQITGRDQTELVGEYLAALTVPEDAAQRLEDIERLIAGEHDTHRGELRLRHGTVSRSLAATRGAILG